MKLVLLPIVMLLENSLILLGLLSRFDTYFDIKSESRMLSPQTTTFKQVQRKMK